MDRTIVTVYTTVLTVVTLQYSCSLVYVVVVEPGQYDPLRSAIHITAGLGVKVTD